MGALIVVILGVVVLGQSSDVSDLQAESGARADRVSDLGSQNEELASDIAATKEALSASNQKVAQLEKLLVEQEAALTDASDATEALQDGLDSRASDLRNSRRDLTEARSENRELQELIAELALAYDSDITAARETLASAASSFACAWGAGLAGDGESSQSITGEAAWRAFTSSSEFEAVTATPEVSAAFTLLDTLGAALPNSSPDQFGEIAIECWQEEDATINAALYTYQSVFRNAVLDAACTHGNGSAYPRTSEYLSWRMTVGDDVAIEYAQSVRDRFGSMEDFVALSAADIDEASERCSDSRELIEPKSSGTWNVGDEIKPGTWKAYDVSDCYWARLAEDGRIRANHFGDGLRLSVNVSSSDGQFEISGCTFYYSNP